MALKIAKPGRRLWLGLGVVALLLAVATYWLWPNRPVERRPLALMTSLPVYWPETVNISDVVSGRAPLPWVRQELERHFILHPLETLSPDSELADAPSPLAGRHLLLIAQPRGFSPADNVALDEWVRGGGQALIAIDPMLTGHYDVPIFDPRHPVVSALIPNVLAHWGLEVHFNENQPLEMRLVDLDGTPLPVLMAGQLALTGEGRQNCHLKAQDIVADCRIGKGRALVVADAAFLEHGQGEATASDAINALMELAFPARAD